MTIALIDFSDLEHNTMPRAGPHEGHQHLLDAGLSACSTTRPGVRLDDDQRHPGGLRRQRGRAGDDVLGLVADGVLHPPPRSSATNNSVKTAGSGVRLRVLDANADRSVYTVQVDKK